RLQELPRHPGELCTGRGDRFDAIQHLGDRERLLRTDRVIRSEFLHFRHADHPFREIARIYELARVIGFVWGEHFAALVYTRRPIRETVGAVERPDDETRSDDRVDARILILHFHFGA